MAAEQVAEHLARHAGRSPGGHLPRGNDSRIGKAGLFGYRVVLLNDGDFVAVSGQLISRGDTYDASTKNRNLHRAVTVKAVGIGVESGKSGMGWIITAPALSSGPLRLEVMYPEAHRHVMRLATASARPAAWLPNFAAQSRAAICRIRRAY